MCIVHVCVGKDKYLFNLQTESLFGGGRGGGAGDESLILPCGCLVLIALHQHKHQVWRCQSAVQQEKLVS